VATKVKIGKWQYQLQVMNAELKNLINRRESPDIKELSKFYFALYEDYDDELTSEIISLFSDAQADIFMETITFLRNDTKAFDVVKTSLLMLLNSFTIDLTYNLLKNIDNTECVDMEIVERFLLPTRSSWKQQLSLVADYIKQKESYFLNTWVEESDREVKSFTESNRHLSNGQIATRLNALLSKKYPWREWFVVVLLKTNGFGEDTGFFIHTCKAKIHHLGRRDVLVSSSVPTEEKFELASNLLKKVERGVNFWNPFVDRAREINKLVGATCNDFAMFGTASEDSSIRISGRHVALSTETTVLKLDDEVYITFLMF